MFAQLLLRLTGPMDQLRLVWQTGETLLESVPFEDNAESIRYHVLLALQEMVTNVLRHAYDQIEDERASGATLAEIAAKHGLDIRTIEGVDNRGRTADGPADIPGGSAVLTEAYQSDVGVENNPVQIDGGGYVWYDVTKIDPTRARTFSSTRNPSSTPGPRKLVPELRLSLR